MTITDFVIRAQAQPVSDDDLAKQVGTDVETYKKFSEQAKGAGSDEMKVKLKRVCPPALSSLMIPTEAKFTP